MLNSENSLHLIMLIAAALALGLYIRFGSRSHPQTRADRLQKEYRFLSRVVLDGIPDSELVDAVVANMMAGLDPKNPDDYRDIPLQSRGRCAVYSIWITCCELRTGGIRAYQNGPSGRFAELAADGFELVGADRCSAALKAVRAMEKPEPEALEEAGRCLEDAIEQENPLALCREYIRTNPEEFTDD